MKLLVSACLLGVACRYDGRSKLHPLAQELCRRRHQLVTRQADVRGDLRGAAHAPAPLRTPGGRRVCKRRR